VTSVNEKRDESAGGAIGTGPVMSRVVRQDLWGGPETLSVADVEAPSPLPTEVRVRVHAAGVNPVDVFTREGVAYLDAVSLPFSQGWDVAGVVDAVGYGVTRFAVGDAVFGMPWFPRPAGAYADHVTAPARQLARMPERATFEEAAALPMAGLTAWQMLVDVARVAKGERVLVTGAAGAVGHLAVQIARAHGAEVTALAKPRRHGFVRSLGVDHVVDATDDVSGMDVVIDLVGPELCLDSLRTLRPGGRLVSALAAWVPRLTETASELGVSARWYLVEPDAGGLEALAALVDDGRLRVHVDRVMALDEAAEAHEVLRRREVVGKLVLSTGA